MKKELDFWTKSTTMGARDWCDRLCQAEQKFREAAEKNARLVEALRYFLSKLQTALAQFVLRRKQPAPVPEANLAAAI